MKALLHKELLALRPYLWATLVLGVVLLLSDLLATTFLLGPAQALLHDTDGWLILSGTLTFAVAHASVAPELRLGHVHFLDALPVSRRQVYLAKVMAGGLVVLAILVITGAMKLLIVAATTSEHTASTQAILASLFVHQAAALIASYGFGALLSWLGGLGWALLLLSYTGLFVVAESSAGLRPLSIFHGYGTVRFDQGEVRALLWPAQAWFLFGGLSTIISGVLFCGPGHALIDRGSRWMPKAQRALVLFIFGLMILLGVIAAIGLVGPAGDRLTQRSHLVREAGFEVLISEDSKAQAMPIVEELSEIDASVRAVMNRQDSLHIAIEFMGGGRYHAGQYTGGKIRLSAAKDGAHVLAHELAHAYAHEAAQDALTRHMDHLRFFNEGLAMWVADQAVGTSSSSDAFRAWAGAIWTMQHHHFDALTEDKARGVRFDPFEPYPLGLVFVEALVDEGGPEAPLQVLRAIAGLPLQRLSGRTVWYRLAHATGIDLQSALRHYESRLRVYAQRWPSDVRVQYATPLSVQGGLVLLTADAKANNLRCRFRSRKEAQSMDLLERPVRNGVCRVANYDAAENTISFQIGQTLSTGWVAYGPWAQAPVPED